MWFETALKETHDINTQRFGHWKHVGAPEGNVLIRVLRWNPGCWQNEADPRHAELLVEQPELASWKPLSTPGADDDDKDSEEDRTPLVGADMILFRGTAARCIHLATDRPDLMFPSREVCREMSCPVVGSLKMCRRIVRYLMGKPRLLIKRNPRTPCPRGRQLHPHHGWFRPVASFTPMLTISLLSISNKLHVLVNGRVELRPGSVLDGLLADWLPLGLSCLGFLLALPLDLDGVVPPVARTSDFS